jgi:PII-like signaling protein
MFTAAVCYRCVAGYGKVKLVHARSGIIHKSTNALITVQCILFILIVTKAVFMYLNI